MSDHNWPLGAALEEARVRRGWAKREAARAAGISAPLWVTLERGYEVRQDKRLDANPRPETVVKAARAVGLDIDEALAHVGHTRADIADPAVRAELDLPLTLSLSSVSDEELLAEVSRRMRRTPSVMRPPTREEIAANPERFVLVDPGMKEHREPGSSRRKPS